MTASGINVVDVNVWLALSVSHHVHRTPAMAWFNGQRIGTCAFCRMTQLALLRHVTNSKIMGVANVLTQIQAWSAFDALLADARVTFLDEPPALNSAFRSLAQRPHPAHKRWTDDYVAAFAMQHQLGIVTFDSDFKAYTGLSVTLLVP